MLNIVICDDNKIFLDKLEKKINIFLHDRKIKHQITRFYNTESILQSNISQVDVIFLDVNFDIMSGIDVAYILRKISQKFILIFISGYIEYAPTGYQVNALRYILKNQLDLFFDEAMEEVLKQLGFFRNKMTFKFIGGEKVIYTDNILYIESSLHEVRFHFLNDTSDQYYFYATLNSVQAQLPQDEFIRIHQSYLVNVKYFLNAKNYRALLTGNIELPIRQKLFSTVKKQLFFYKGRVL